MLIKRKGGKRHSKYRSKPRRFEYGILSMLTFLKKLLKEGTIKQSLSIPWLTEDRIGGQVIWLEVLLVLQGLKANSKSYLWIDEEKPQNRRL